VEFIPLEYKDHGVATFKSPYLERPEWLTKDRMECFKKQLLNARHDYKIVSDTLYIRAYLQNDENAIMNMVWIWGRDPKKDKPCKNYFGAEVRNGFFPKYTGYNEFSYFLDKLIMWKWNEPKKKD
jgi:hypothetical protein